MILANAVPTPAPGRVGAAAGVCVDRPASSTAAYVAVEAGVAAVSPSDAVTRCVVRTASAAEAPRTGRVPSPWGATRDPVVACLRVVAETTAADPAGRITTDGTDGGVTSALGSAWVVPGTATDSGDPGATGGASPVPGSGAGGAASCPAPGAAGATAGGAGVGAGSGTVAPGPVGGGSTGRGGNRVIGST